ncbi:acyl-CoA dehydrogenase family protein [Virgibacillus alimentarius]|uniref:Alkylation response protein AidB-like acyl-CoA dehydrogenase n=1 Tax=Virgibacillus alimentarius TaxID=698769 RepID=A0ABS4SAZ2_9BACI|nr:acyl-CoA dehydrogenase family protein [Virgibacillus alimentarius]MBP2258671.1 alkylation response protein AidB-like acyl-CoA dehydrogenase [Virgibacillus alimentarius]
MDNMKTGVAGGSFLIKQTDLEDTFFPEDLTEEHKMIQRTAQQFITKEVHPRNKEIEEQQEFDVVVELLKKAGDLGLLAHSIPKKYGGLGLDKISKGIVGEALGNAGGYSVAHSNHTCIATFPITYYGTQAQKEKYLPKLASGEYIGAYCLTEPEAGSDAMAARTTAVLNGAKTHYLLNGTKIYITNAQFSDTFIVYAKVDGEHFTAFVVEKDFPGLSLGPEEKKMGIRGSSTRSVIFEDCEVPVDNVIGEIGKGHIVAFTVLNLGRFNLGSACTGGAKYAFKQTIRHVRERKQFHQTLADFGATKEKIAKMAARLYAAESIQYRTSYLLEESLAGLDQKEDACLVRTGMSEYAMECAICKVYGSETLDYLADEGVQLHGGVGFISEYPIEQIYRDSRINRIFEGTNEVNRLLLTGEFLKKSMKGLLPYEEAVKSAFGQLVKESTNTTEELVEDLRALYLVMAEFARRKYGNDLESQQEVLMKLSDLAIHLYASESVVLRTEKSTQNKALKKQLRDTVLEEAVNQTFLIVRQLEQELLEDEQAIRQQIYASLTSHSFSQSIHRNRNIAETMYEKGEYAG